MNPKLLFLDFDGVVADSMPAKTRALVAAFDGLGFDADAIAALYRRYAGSGRERTFDRVFEALAGRPMSTAQRARVARRFAKLEADAAAGLELFPGVAGFLARAGIGRRLVLVTGTPREAIAGPLARLGIESCFAALRSATRAEPKESLIADEIARAGLASADALFVGDSLVDMAAAARVPVDFVGVGKPEFFADGSPLAVIGALPDLESLLEG